MPTSPLLELTDESRLCLQQARDYHPKPYLRERAAALLKIDAGEPVREVAAKGLLRPRHTNTLYRWVQEYQAEGIVGLRIRVGRGRKPAFFPSASSGSAGDAAAHGPL